MWSIDYNNTCSCTLLYIVVPVVVLSSRRCPQWPVRLKKIMGEIITTGGPRDHVY